MTDPIITVEGLGKKYRIEHLKKGRRYTALRDVFAERAKRGARRIGALLRSGASPSDSSNLQPTSEEFWALKDVSFEIKQGDVVGIIGRNGAGKSTLLKILSRITEPSEGRVRIKGRVASLLEVGTGFHPELTGRENISLNGAILGMSRGEIRAKFDEIVAFADVEKFLDTPVKHYSSGMYVRLAFAVAAHLEPEVLIVDEVLAVGDAQFQKKCMGKMQDVATKEGRTVLFVSHSMTAIKSLTKRTILMDKGHVACNANTDEAVSKYLKLTFAGATESSILKSKGLHSNVTSVKLLDELGNSTASYTPGTIFNLEIYFSTDGTQNMSIELFLVDMNQTRLAIASLYQLNGVSLPTVAGNYVCKLRLEPMWLAGGSYSLDIATSQVNAAWDHQVDRIFTFTVVFSNPKGFSWDLKYSDGYGAFAWLAQDNLEIVRLSDAELGKEAVAMACD